MGTMVQNGYNGTEWVQWYRMGTMVQMYKVMFHVKHSVLKIYSVGCAFIAIPDVSAVVLLVSGFVAGAFSGSFLDWQSFCEQELQPRFVVKH